jgi:hypothetical protein
MPLVPEFLRRLFSKGPSEFEVAETASAEFLQFIERPSNHFQFDFKAIPLSPEIQPMLGFISSACDVFAQRNGGQSAGLGSINATLRVYQALFDESKTEGLMEVTFELCREPREPFKLGWELGNTYANALVRGDSDVPTKTLLYLFTEKYSKYCANPEGT